MGAATGAEILIVATAGTGLARAAEGLLRAALAARGWDDRLTLRSSEVPGAPDRLVPGVTVGRVEHGRGYDLRDRPPSRDRLAEADLVLVLSEAERRAVIDLLPAAAGKVRRLADLAGVGEDVVDGDEPSLAAFERRIDRLQPLVDLAAGRIAEVATGARAATMARVGLATDLFYYELAPPPLPAILADFARAGVGHVEWYHGCHPHAPHRYTTAELDELAALLDELGLRCDQVHGFENSDWHALADGQALEEYLVLQANRIELCARLGGRSVVLHLPGGVPALGAELPPREALARSTGALDRLRPLCERLGVTLAVENFPRDRDFERLEFYFDRYPADFITFCLDTGHANLAGQLEGLMAYGERLAAVHLHDNRRLTEPPEDDHQPPFFGTVDLPAVLAWMAEIGYPGALNFELLYVRHLFDGDHHEFLADALQRIRRAIGLAPAAVGARPALTEGRAWP